MAGCSLRGERPGAVCDIMAAALFDSRLDSWVVRMIGDSTAS